MRRKPGERRGGGALKPITLRNLPEAVGRAVRERAEHYRVSLNQSVIRLLEDAVGAPRAREAEHHDLDQLIGSWSASAARSAERALEAQRRIDPEMWK